MNFRQNIAYFIRHLREKHRLSVRNQHTDREIWYMHISPLNLLAGLLALILILFILIASTVAYTPVLDLLPGYPGKKSRTMLVENIMRLDSLEQELRNMQVYSENIALIMAGRNPVTRNDMLEADSLSAKKGATVAAIAEDSLLRAQMETPGSPYSLYDPDAIDNRFGVSLATTSNQQVMAVMDGTVISAPWTPEDGFVLYVQHANNMISVYRHNVSVLKKAGDRVSSGEIIGYTGGENALGQDKNLFEFELWHNGTPVDPQGYIVF